MTKPLSPNLPQESLDEMARLVAERVPAEMAIPAEYAAAKEATEEKFAEARRQTDRQYEEDKAANEAQYESARRDVLKRFRTDDRTTQQEYERLRSEVVSKSDAAETDRKQQLQEAQWEASTIFEATKDGPAIELGEIEKRLIAGQQEFESIGQGAVAMLRRRKQWREYPAQPPGDAPQDVEPARRFAQLLVQSRSQGRALAALWVSGTFEGGWPVMLLLGLWLVAMIPAYFIGSSVWWHWLAFSGAAAVVAWIALEIWLYRIARRQSAEGYLALKQTIAEADVGGGVVLQAARVQCKQRNEEILRQRDEALKEADEEFSAAMTKIHDRKQADLEQLHGKYPPLLAQIKARHDREMDEARQRHDRQHEETESQYAADSNRLTEEYAREKSENEQRYRDDWQAMQTRWTSGIAQIHATLDGANEACRLLFPAWDAVDWDRFTPPTEVPSAIRFGRYDVALEQLEGGVPKDERLLTERTEFELPAMLPFPRRSALLFNTTGGGRDRAVEAIRSVMLRMLASLPPGKIRFTIVDPVGLGENFSAFMHLADFDDQIVTSRIWTDRVHIEQRLTDLTEHMENVLQLYLRNEFDTIQEYNDFAGEMAEPYRVLVIANFPTAFSDGAARRLASIVASGARCGVYTVLSVDDKQQMPRDFHLADLQSQAATLVWRNGQFTRKHADFGQLPLVLDEPPEAGLFTQIVRSVGRQAQDADRVEVPFDCVVPERSQWWTADSSAEIDVPLGRAGALKLQHLNLGRGTSQHVLLSGKTGSGKSTLLHALITSLAIRYSPDQVELYLVDFKKGVEFKAYATHQLPHARVIAIESEREFGLSVLQRLDTELKTRGDLFRNLGVQDLKGFRAAKAEVAMPRILLIIDEFQELFVEEDRIAQDSSLLLDRLVRQGRAFGIHVLLGSQTLAGAYSLARSTIGQMAVRIALQCSDADAHLILSEENTAARLLARPGEAIYNDANGQFEGNHPFQVVWLSDQQREAVLGDVRQLADERQLVDGRDYRTTPPIVFEGNVPADLSRNHTLGDLLSADAWPEPSRSQRAWLGSAVAIKDPTAAVFSRQGGSNLMMVGHREEAAMGVLAAAMIGLAAQCRPGDAKGGVPGARFYVLDGTRPDVPEAGYFKRLVSALPHATRVAVAREAADAIAELAGELSRREEAGVDDAPPIYLVIYDVARFRELRRADDDFGFSSHDDDAPPNSAKQFGNILREGPPLGIHTLLWCDTYNNVNRWFDRQALRDLELRVLFQMNSSDSSNLIDSPAAARLGVHRAIFYNEGLGHLEKFRPYGLPADEWLEQVREGLGARD
ncbi:MAG: AAA family ATPase [Candidatus Nealsonbacteria bacterium]|nr:AAA family ATPase [Candidatus Nealsonbacteria bacterium]